MSVVTQSTSGDTIKLPSGYTAYLFGFATSRWMQQVVFKVQTTSGRDLDESKFQGLDGPMVVTSGGFKLGFLDQQTVVIPADKIKTRHLEFIFSAYENQTLATGKAEEMKGFQKDQYTSTVVPWVTNYIYRTEDGGDSDFSDTTFIVTLVKE
ncbi:hypothetical protein K503DRAFT_859759 [Rhizopogon vinicolor AM-OR11-026]|uniref:Uncharacterized protein n=1 Tax=Rhizopogon vinicolor AM-OR11-026 TaxID=1314800 RepID=A0A1B7MLN6_9AGAM|nr:hypothetical protein K503DRAFT_859759 [Rhizopogon vinicolor AM-OR11-026]